MSNVVFNDTFCNKEGISPNELMVLYFLYRDWDFNAAFESLKEKHFLMRESTPNSCYLTTKGENLINKWKSQDLTPENEYLELATALKELFPKGKKNGSPYYWAEAVPLIIKRLQLFEKKYGKYSDEVILDAAKRYVESFGSSNFYMKTLKYFIFSEKVVNGSQESTSELLNFIENKGEESIQENDWTQTLR